MVIIVKAHYSHQKEQKCNLGVHLLASVLQYWIYFTHKLTLCNKKKERSKNHEMFSGKSSINSYE